MIYQLLLLDCLFVLYITVIDLNMIIDDSNVNLNLLSDLLDLEYLNNFFIKNKSKDAYVLIVFPSDQTHKTFISHLTHFIFLNFKPIEMKVNLLPLVNYSRNILKIFQNIKFF
jgi:hypothetical protein